ncbi:MAG: aminotransferase class V-fold PLP-dependent enzyme [bacterium]
MTPIDPAALRTHYRRFLREDRILLTGHSHQAWPDAAERGLLAAFADAAEHVDDKWSRAAARADVLRRAVAAALATPGRPVAPDEIALATNSHELTTRVLSALDWRRGRHLVTTDGEFHSLRRQLLRLAEAGAEISFVPVEPITTLAARMAQAVRPDTIGLLASTVLYRTAAIVPHLEEAITAAHRVGAAVLLDAYHAFNVVPQPLAALGPDPVFVTGGGYKYAQWGEGCCWLRVPPGCALRPMHTGWFSDFAGLDGKQGDRIGYGRTGADRFAGSTYDPASHYRAAAVVEFFAEQQLTLDRLRALSQHQTSRLTAALADLDLVSPREAHDRGGFVTVRHPAAREAVAALRACGIYTDARDDLLRLGPAPYITDDALDAAAAAVRALLGP